jgi:hypothetical protein
METSVTGRSGFKSGKIPGDDISTSGAQEMQKKLLIRGFDSDERAVYTLLTRADKSARATLLTAIPSPVTHA